MVSSKSVDTG